MKYLSSLTSFFIILLVVLFVLIVLYVIQNIKNNKVIYNKLNEICTDYGYTLEKGKDVDYIFKKNSFCIKIVIAKIPKNSSVTVNSKLTWCLRWGGKRNGRSYPNQRYMNELIPFLKMKSEDNVLKLIVLYPQTEKVQKYLNESEIALVNLNELVYDYKIVSFLELDEFFLNL